MAPALADEEVLVRRNDTAVKVDAEIVSEAKMVAASRGISLAEYLSELLRLPVHKDLEDEMTRRLSAGHGRPRPKRP